MPQLSHLAKSMAGKSDPDGGGLWLPLWMHARDTADIFCRLVQNWLPAAVRVQIGLEEEVLVQTVRFLGLVHDLGKATALFQSRILQHIPEAYERLNAQLPLPSQFRDERETPHARASDAILQELECPLGLASVAGAHHGKPQAENFENYVCDQMELYPGNYWGKGQKKQWKALWREIYQMALEESGFASGEALPQLTVPAQLLLTGLLTMADWIASNRKYFPLIPVEELGQEALYPERSNRAWRQLSLTSPWELCYVHMDDQAFEERFGFTPNPIQQAVYRWQTTSPHRAF